MSKQFDIATYQNMIFLHWEKAMQWKNTNNCVISSFSKKIGIDQLQNLRLIRLVHQRNFGYSDEDMLGSIISLTLNLNGEFLDKAQSNNFINTFGKMKNLANLELIFTDVSFKKINIDAIDLIPRIGDLKELKKLNLVLRSCLNQSNRIQQLIDNKALAELTQLKYIHLDLSNDKLEDSDAKYLSQMFSKFQLLQNIELNFANNGLTEKGLKLLCDGIISNTNLEALKIDLTSNSIQDFQFLERLEHLGSLRSLKLIFQNLDLQTNIRQISSTLKNLSHLEFLLLDLQSTRLTKDSLFIFSEAIIKLTHLNHFHINVPFNDFLESTGINYLTASLATLLSLQSLQLNLKGTCIENTSIKDISSAIDKLPQLRQLGLDVSYNKYDNQGIEYLTSSIAKLSNLHSLTLILNITMINDKVMQQLINAIIYNLDKLSSLSLNIRHLNISSKCKVLMRANLIRKSKYLTYFNQQ